MDYARALVEHPKWRWEPGMYAVDPATLMGVFVVIDSMVSNAERHAHRIPGIAHPATKGWLLHMLREVSDFCPYAIRLIDGFEDGAPVWCVYDDHDHLLADARTEGEALAAALLAVWGLS